MGDVILIASELVSNAVLHSGCTSADTLAVQVDRTGDRLVVSVADPGLSGRTAAVAVAEQRAAGGLGLWIVEQVARAWGAERTQGYRVWAELSLAVPAG